MNSFFPDAIASWNISIKHFDDVPSFNILYKHIIFRPKTKSTFGIHDPVGLRYLFQFRVSLSPLGSLRYVVANKALKIRVILYFHVLSMQFKEQP